MKIIIHHNGKKYNFKFGYEAMIFDCAISNEFDTKYGEHTIKNFVNFVSACYLKAPHDISLGDLADFIVLRWEELKELSYYETLAKFYDKTAQ